jgi:hypothetical protein
MLGALGQGVHVSKTPDSCLEPKCLHASRSRAVCYLANQKCTVAAISDCGIQLVAGSQTFIMIRFLGACGLTSQCEPRHGMQNCNVSCEQH